MIDPQNLNWLGLAGLGASFGVIAATWRQCQAILSRITSLLFARAVVSNEAYSAVVSYICDKSRTAPLGLRMFDGGSVFVNKVNRSEIIAVERLSDKTRMVWVGRWPIFVHRAPFGSNGNSVPNLGSNIPLEQTVYITCIRGTVDLEQFVVDAVKTYSQRLQGVETGISNDYKTPRFMVSRVHGSHDSSLGRGHVSQEAKEDSPSPKPSGSAVDIERWLRTKLVRLLGWNLEDIGIKPNTLNPFIGYAFPPSLEPVLHEIETWLKSEAWFREKRIPWRRGYLWLGPPGTGKSTAIRCIGMKFDLPVFLVDLSGMTNDSFTAIWQKISTAAPCIIALEDFDAVFNGRENIACKNLPHVGLTFDCLLNTISGIGNSDGILLMVTSNRPETFDPALFDPKAEKASRPGRIDRAIYLGVMERTEREAVANFILKDFPDLIDKTIELGEGETAAQFQNRCAQLAMDKFWTDKSKES